MSKILSLLKHGTSFAAGVAVGASLTQEQDTYSEDRFTGRTCEMRVSYDEAERWLVRIQNWLDSTDDVHSQPPYNKKTGCIECEGVSFVERDLKDMRRKLTHAMSSTDEGDTVTVEITDRERLSFYDCIAALPVKATGDSL